MCNITRILLMLPIRCYGKDGNAARLLFLPACLPAAASDASEKINSRSRY